MFYSGNVHAHDIDVSVPTERDARVRAIAETKASRSTHRRKVRFDTAHRDDLVRNKDIWLWTCLNKRSATHEDYLVCRDTGGIYLVNGSIERRRHYQLVVLR